MDQSQSQLRKRMREARRALPIQTQREFSKQACERLLKCPITAAAGCVGAYVANSADGELDLQHAVEGMWDRGQAVAAPVVTTGQATLTFAAWQADSALVRGAFDIPRPPDSAARVPLQQIDLLLLPLVAYDDAGQRIGMGGGYYDRTLAGLRQGGASGPRLLGVAYKMQRSAQKIAPQAWDVPLDGILTEDGISWWRQ